MDMSREFEIKPAANGGVIITASPYNAPPGRIPETLGAFTSPADMIAWLAEQYGITVHAVAAGGKHISVSSSIFGDRAGESIVPKSPSGDEWTEWGGASNGDPVLPLDSIVAVRYRGKPREGETFTETPAKASGYSWAHFGRNSDIVAYRVVSGQTTASEPYDPDKHRMRDYARQAAEHDRTRGA